MAEAGSIVQRPDAPDDVVPGERIGTQGDCVPRSVLERPVGRQRPCGRAIDPEQQSRLCARCVPRPGQILLRSVRSLPGLGAVHGQHGQGLRP